MHNCQIWRILNGTGMLWSVCRPAARRTFFVTQHAVDRRIPRPTSDRSSV